MDDDAQEVVVQRGKQKFPFFGSDAQFPFFGSSSLMRLFSVFTCTKGLRVWHRLSSSSSSSSPPHHHHHQHHHQHHHRQHHHQHSPPPPHVCRPSSNTATITCCADFYFLARIKHMCVRSRSGSERDLMEAAGSEDRYEFGMDGGASSCQSMDGLSLDLLGDGGGGGGGGGAPVSFSTLLSCGEAAADVGSSSQGFSSSSSLPLGWPLAKLERLSTEPSHASSNITSTRHAYMWEEKRDKRDTELAEVEMMKEKFAKLLLGEDMSGGAKGVCTAMAISNAITNLSASVFGQLWRLEPLASERRVMWQREMEWLLSVSDYIVELVPTRQSFPDGSTLEVMVSRPRSDLHLNLPALRKLDNLLLDSLDSYRETEFWYVDHGILVSEKNKNQLGCSRDFLQRQEEKWWLPTPKVPVNGLSEDSRKKLHLQRDATSQILKAAMAINTQVLSEMEVPDIYLNALLKNGRSSVGDLLYRDLSSDNFSAELFLSALDTSDEHNILDVTNQLETAVVVIRQETHLKQAQLLWGKEKKFNPKAAWGKMREFVGDVDRRLLLADRAESVLFGLKQRVPGLPQTSLDTNKIQFNRDVGQSILESYSRVLESLAFNIIARVDDVLYADDQVVRSLLPPVTPGRDCIANSHHPSHHDRSNSSCNTQSSTAHSTPYATPFVSPSASPTNPDMTTTPSPPRENTKGTGTQIASCLDKALSQNTGREIPECTGEQESSLKLVKLLHLEASKQWTYYAGHLENSNALHSPPGRD